MRLTRKLTLLLSFIFLSSAALFAQSGKITLQVYDADIPTLPVAGAIVELIPTANPDGKIYFATDGMGALSVPTIAYGDYSVSVSFLGYETAIVPFKLDRSEVVLPNIMMKSSSVQMDAVVKEIKALRSSQKGDTLNYNASAFKVSADADVEGLLEKMPGIAIEDGEVTAQGEQIKKIYVDGREFFGNDVATALKSLPAEVVDRIEVYDKLSDSAEMSGMDDGEGEKTINIVTHKSMRQGIFGKVFAGGGYEPDAYSSEYGKLDKPKYMAGGSANLFYDTSRISVIGLANNINQQNFSFEDIMGVSGEEHSSNSSFMVKPLPGVAVVNAVGVNYSDVFGESDKVKVQASYFFNKTETTNEESIKRWYEESTDPRITIIDSLEQTVYKVTGNSNHRLNGRIDWKISDKSNIMIRPTFSLQTSDPNYMTYGMRYDADNTSSGYNREVIDGLKLDGAQMFKNNGDSYWSGFNLGTSANYRLKLSEKGRNVTVGAGISVNRYNNESEYNNEAVWKNSATITDDEGEKHYIGNYTDLYTFTESPSNRLNLSANVGYVEPLVDHWTLNITYRISRNYQETEKNMFDTNEFYLDRTYDPDASNTVESTYITHRAGPGIRYGKGKSNIVGNIYYQSSQMKNETVKYSIPSYVDKTFDNILYSIVGQVYFNPQNSLRVYINSYTSNPSVGRLQNVVNNPSSDYITMGNDDLDPAYNNRLRLRYTHSNLEKGSTIMAMLSATHTNNYFSSHIVTQPNDFNLNADGSGEEMTDKDQYTTWVNLDNYWNFYTRVNFGFPLDKIKCNLNFNVGASYSIIPNIFGGHVENGGKITGGVENSTDKISYKAGLTLGSNISENLDFTLKWWGDYNEATNVTATSQNLNTYYNQTASFTLKWVFLKGFTFTGAATYRQFAGITDDYNIQYTLLNGFIGHKVFKNKRGEISVGVNDALNQNNSFWRSIGSNYAQNTENITIGRYYSAQFIYSLRYFGGKGSTNMKDYKGMDKYMGDGGSSHKKKKK